MASTSTKVGHGLAKVLGIKLDYRNETGNPTYTNGESVYSIESADSYVEHEPTALEWLQETAPSWSDVGAYFWSLFPFLHWITKYNLQWFTGDMIAGITIGAVVVPQGMAYAKLAELPVEYGLYTSFMGVLIYWFFATSKDITIGPVAVLSQVTGNVVLLAAKRNPSIPAHVVASALSVISGAVVCFIGLARLGWLVEFISLASIAAYMTGSAINICVGQVPTLMGISSTYVNNRAPTYRVIINTLKNLGHTKIDAAMGLTALFLLYAIRSTFNLLATKYPNQKKIWFFCNTLRTVFVILLYTLISWLVNLHLKGHKSSNSPFKILGTVPRGFKHAAVPDLDASVIKAFASELPSTIIVMLIEHISIAKSFGRVNNYVINPSQELVAIGVTNLLGPFLGAYPATGSFSRTAIKAKAGVRTPFAGFITAIVVLLAIYALPAVFFYIPSASLSGVIIHAVGDLVTPPNTVYQFWKVSPLEVIIFFAGVLTVVFSSIENGVYVTICTSFFLIVWRMFLAKGRFLGRVKVHNVVGDHALAGKSGIVPGNDPDRSVRNVYMPIDHEDGSNPGLHVDHPYPGIFIYRFSEGFNYPNANHYLDHMVNVIFETTRRTNPNSYARLGDRPWNDPGKSRSNEPVIEDHKPTLKAVILDFSSVNNVDITSVQTLIDVRNQLDRYTAPEKVQWHFACINSRWTKRALVSAGFGYPTPTDDHAGFQRFKPLFSVAEMGGEDSAAAAADYEARRRESQYQRDDIESESASSHHASFDKNAQPGSYKQQLNSRIAVVQGLNRPFFHFDLTSALQSAIFITEAHGEGRETPDLKELVDADAKGPVVPQERDL
ncbi:sulfate permease-like protein [Teratosphaeria nubilosa]|uniref:Sulfate permease-like protein n=1 Tax=Teratosphaeria nubilosa TaxID=161662 RepID=A0A6G1LGG6_9PEZI|nr:sulfate permease-like protein [Teratosphaeria nubilosa]